MRAAATTFSWWQMIFGKQYSRHSLCNERRSEDGELGLDLSGTEKLYLFIPVSVFRELTDLKMNSTSITSKHFQQIARSAEFLQTLEIADCLEIDQTSFFMARPYLSCELEIVDISRNPKFTVLAVACLCSCTSIHRQVLHDIKLSPEGTTFLTKNFRDCCKRRTGSRNRRWHKFKSLTGSCWRIRRGDVSALKGDGRRNGAKFFLFCSHHIIPLIVKRVL